VGVAHLHDAGNNHCAEQSMSTPADRADLHTAVAARPQKLETAIRVALLCKPCPRMTR